MRWGTQQRAECPAMHPRDGEHPTLTLSLCHNPNLDPDPSRASIRRRWRLCRSATSGGRRSGAPTSPTGSGRACSRSCRRSASRPARAYLCKESVLVANTTDELSSQGRDDALERREHWSRGVQTGTKMCHDASLYAAAVRRCSVVSQHKNVAAVMPQQGSSEPLRMPHFLSIFKTWPV